MFSNPSTTLMVLIDRKAIKLSTPVVTFPASTAQSVRLYHFSLSASRVKVHPKAKLIDKSAVRSTAAFVHLILNGIFLICLLPEVQVMANEVLELANYFN